jgi:peroxiredoxin
MKTEILAVAPLLLFGFCATCQGADKKEYLALIGKPAPHIETNFAINGKASALSDFKGKVVVLQFWATWCPHCRESNPYLRKLARTHKSVQIIGINSDLSQEKLKEFAAKEKMDWLLLHANEKQMSKMRHDFKSNAIPQFVIIDREGVVRHVFVGFEKKDEEHITHAVNQLLADKN